MKALIGGVLWLLGFAASILSVVFLSDSTRIVVMLAAVVVLAAVGVLLPRRDGG